MTYNLDTLLQEMARRQPEHAALLGPRPADRWSYPELNDAVGRAAAHLDRAGLRAGDCVGLHYRSGREYIVYNYAIWRCGASVVPIPIELQSPEKREIARQISLDFLISSTRDVRAVDSLFARSPREIDADALAGHSRKLRDRPSALNSINCAFVRFTSGTTAKSKGVILSHETIDERIRAANEVLSIGPADRIVWVLSMSYHFAVSIVAYLSFGATIVLPQNNFASGVMKAVNEHRATMLYASPTHYQWLADFDHAQPVASLRLAVSTTAPLASEVARQFQRRMRLPLSQALGIIEAGLPFINTSFAETKPESVGRIVPGYEFCMKDIGMGASRREVLLRGKGVFDAYYEPWRTRGQLLSDGWFHTGDIGEVDKDGCLFLHGRTKDIISVLGMKFFPQEVEAALESHPSVAQATVFGRPDARWGEVPCARVVKREEATRTGLEHELRTHCRKLIADYKVPEDIELVKQLPKTASGKIVRRAVPPGPPSHVVH
jgi:long-chain acyl-CoA synthetase